MPPWMDPAKEYISLLKDIVTVIAAGIASVAAIVGLSTWRRQLKGNTEYDLSRKLLRSLYATRNAVSAVRNPWQSAGEISQAMKEADLEANFHDEKFALLSAQAVYRLRWKSVVEATAALQIDALEAEALWGSEARDHLKPLYVLISELFSNIQLYLRNLERPPHNQSEEASRAIDEIIYDTSGSERPNEYSQKLGAAIAEMEAFIRPRLKL